ncbi:MAG: DUF1559 domain-containing protein, partial [Pirellulales bacterium]|nr:DUF1559 domain-containing protein [Pirellulales bacterium]
VQAAREAARRMQCSNNLKQIGLGVHSFHDARNVIPPAYLTGRGHASWFVLIMPYLEQATLFDDEFENMSYYGLPEEVVQNNCPIYLCPSHRSAPALSIQEPPGRSNLYGNRHGALTDYAINAGDGYGSIWGLDYNGISRATHTFDGITEYNGILNGSDPTWTYTGWKSYTSFRDVTDGLSHTLLAGEKHIPPGGEGLYNYGDSSYYNDDYSRSIGRLAGPLYPLALSPDDPTIADVNRMHHFGSFHSGGICNFVMADGSVTSLTASINTTLLGYLANRHDGATVSQSDLE